MVLEYCPTEYYINCRYSGKKCGSCRGKTGRPETKLWYQAETANSLSHPALSIKKEKVSKDKQKQRMNKTASKAEDKAAVDLKRLTGIPVRKSVRSGAINRDGDFHMDTLNLQFDHKLRESHSSLGITRTEYLKGLHQGTEAWMITSRPRGMKEVQVVVLTMEAFKRLTSR